MRRRYRGPSGHLDQNLGYRAAGSSLRVVCALLWLRISLLEAGIMTFARVRRLLAWSRVWRFRAIVVVNHHFLPSGLRLYLREGTSSRSAINSTSGHRKAAFNDHSMTRLFGSIPDAQDRQVGKYLRRATVDQILRIEQLLCRFERFVYLIIPVTLCAARIRSAARSPITTHGAMVLPTVMRGMIEASAMRSLSMPYTRS